MFWFYIVCYYLALPFILIRLLWRSRRNQHYRKRWSERFGLVPYLPSTKKKLWVHAVSVGETIAATPLIEGLIHRYPEYQIIVTSTTPTGSMLVLKAFKDKVFHCYSPFDTPTSVNRFLNRVRPNLCVIMETELWPNLYFSCQKRNIPILVANGRLSERSYLRYQFIKRLTTKMLSACHVLLAQGILDGERYLKLGLDPKKLIISGNIKFDMHISSHTIAQGFALKKMIGDRLIFIAASTHEGEEEIVLTALEKIRQKIPSIFLIMVPRHVERFDKVFEQCAARFKTSRRSLQNMTSDTDILLVDSIGELRMIYAAGDLVFVGGSLFPIGGHNLIEPAAMGLPILSGPHLHNFSEISKLLKNAGALQIVNDSHAIANVVTGLCEATELREKIGACAVNTIKENQGALEKHFECIDQAVKFEFYG